MKTIKHSIKGLAVATTATVLAGCVHTANEERESERFLPAYEDILDTVERPVDGAIFSIHATSPLVSDRRARRIGDIITIELKETNTATKSSNAKMTKGGNFNAGLPAGLLGTKTTDAILKSKLFKKDAMKSTSSYDFTGTGTAGQSNSITGQITVTVVKVFRNGNMLIRGEKRLRLTSGMEYIRISGLVRPEDVTPDNRIDSRRVAQAEISYTGAGGVSDATQRGWLNRFFGNISPH